MYDIHNNGAVPFKVTVNQGLVDVVCTSTGKQVLSIKNPKTVFIGESPITATTIHSDAYGPDFRGNSILVETNTKQYTYIGSSIYSFSTDQGIIMYVSEVGNNDVPYPYAIDGKGIYYLMLERVMIFSLPSESSFNPYSYLYAIGEPGNIVGLASEILGIQYLIGSDPDEQFRLSYDREPRRQYQCPWMHNLHAMTNTGELNSISEEEYVEMMKKLGRAFGLIPLSTHQLVPK